MERKSGIKIIIGLGVGFVVCAAMILGFGLIEHLLDGTDRGSLNDEEYSYSDYSGEQIYYEGSYYVPKSSLETLLVLGIDASEERPDSEQSDFVALLILDKDDECFEVLHINRDTMVDIPVIDHYGEQHGTEYAQLALAHTYGADDRAQCRNTVVAVENLLYNINIDHFLSMTMDAVSIINDSVGGVTLELMDDFTFVDPSFTQGAVVTLKGDQALRYVQSRGQMEDSTNLRRMERQRQYIGALFEKLGNVSDDETTETLLDLSEKVYTDYTTDQLSRLKDRLEAYTYNGIVSLPGESVVGEFMEYHMDENAARAEIVRLFYEPLSE